MLLGFMLEGLKACDHWHLRHLPTVILFFSCDMVTCLHWPCHSRLFFNLFNQYLLLHTLLCVYSKLQTVSYLRSSVKCHLCLLKVFRCENKNIFNTHNSILGSEVGFYC